MGIRLSSAVNTSTAPETSVAFIVKSGETQSEPSKRRSVSRSRSFHDERFNRTATVSASRRFSLQTSVQLPACSCYSENNELEKVTGFVSEGITDSLLLLRAELQKRKQGSSEQTWTSKLSKRISLGLKPPKRTTHWTFWKKKSKMGELGTSPSGELETVAPGKSGSRVTRTVHNADSEEASSDSDTSDFQDFGTSPDEIQIVPVENARSRSPIIDLSRFNPDDYPIEDYEERARQERAREMAEGVDPPPGFRPGASSEISPGTLAEIHLNNLTTLFHNSLTMGLPVPQFNALTHISSDLQLLAAQHGINMLQNGQSHRTAHTQVDFIHCLVPDLFDITRCSFYWGKMDRYEAERLLDNKPDGTFLLRDSAQEEYLFSVSFRRYSRSLHARIEQWNHKFSFDSHDPGVFASPTVCGLMEHYKDPSCCMFFEPMLTIPLHRTFVFPLQHMCRAVICNSTTYDGISCLQLPKSLKAYLKEYHYKQRVRVRRLDVE